MKIHDIGDLTGPVLVWGGAYSNLEATKALMHWADAADIAVSNRINTGDAVGYCADPAASWDLVRKHGGHAIKGNVEAQLASAAQDCGCGFEAGSACDALSKDWYAHADRHIDARHRAEMAALPDVLTFHHEGLRGAVIHGGISDIARFVFSVTEDAAFQEEIEALRTLVGDIDLVVAGHSGIPFKKDLGGVTWVNAGAIGMPANDGCSGGNFAMLSSEGVLIKTLEYDAKAAASKMRACGLDQGYDRALLDGWWPSEDVLPASLRRELPVS